MWGFSRYGKHDVMPVKDNIREALVYLMTTDDDFIRAIEISTMSKEVVGIRFQKWTDALTQIIGVPKASIRCFSAALKKDLLAKQSEICPYCNTRILNIDDAHIDHVKPYWIGGETIPENAQLLHRYCNLKKGGGYKPENSVVENFISSNIAGGQVSDETGRAKDLIKEPGVTKPGSYTGKSVTAFIFKNARYEVRSWIAVLSQICKPTYNLHRSSFESVLQLRGSKRSYFTRNPNELRNPQQIEDSDIYMETKLGSDRIVLISVNVILLFGYSEKDLIIEAH